MQMGDDDISHLSRVNLQSCVALLRENISFPGRHTSPDCSRRRAASTELKPVSTTIVRSGLTMAPNIVGNRLVGPMQRICPGIRNKGLVSFPIWSVSVLNRINLIVTVFTHLMFPDSLFRSLFHSSSLSTLMEHYHTIFLINQGVALVHASESLTTDTPLTRWHL